MKRYSIGDCMKVAEDSGGECLSEEYVNMKTKMKWRCDKGHEWNAVFLSIYFNNTWCPYCSGNVKKDIDFCIEFAKKKDGKCLSETYVNIDTKLLWCCKNGHEWKSTPYCVINRGQWCKKMPWKKNIYYFRLCEISKRARRRMLK